MKTITLSLVWQKIMYDLQANTYKQGFLNPREDGREGETQASADEEMDSNIAKRNTLEAISQLLEALKRWSPVVTQDNGNAEDTDLADSTEDTDATDSTEDTDATDSTEDTDTPEETTGLDDDPTHITDGTTWTITLTVTNRNDATSNSVSVLGHSYVVSHITAEWYKLLEPDKARTWEERKATAETRLTATMYHKTAPTLTSN